MTFIDNRLITDSGRELAHVFEPHFDSDAGPAFLEPGAAWQSDEDALPLRLS